MSPAVIEKFSDDEEHVFSFAERRLTPSELISEMITDLAMERASIRKIGDSRAQEIIHLQGVLSLARKQGEKTGVLEFKKEIFKNLLGRLIGRYQKYLRGSSDLDIIFNAVSLSFYHDYLTTNKSPLVFDEKALKEILARSFPGLSYHLGAVEKNLAEIPGFMVNDERRTGSWFKFEAGIKLIEG